MKRPAFSEKRATKLRRYEFNGVLGGFVVAAVLGAAFAPLLLAALRSTGPSVPFLKIYAGVVSPICVLLGDSLLHAISSAIGGQVSRNLKLVLVSAALAAAAGVVHAWMLPQNSSSDSDGAEFPFAPVILWIPAVLLTWISWLYVADLSSWTTVAMRSLLCYTAVLILSLLALWGTATRLSKLTASGSSKDFSWEYIPILGILPSILRSVVRFAVHQVALWGEPDTSASLFSIVDSAITFAQVTLLLHSPPSDAATTMVAGGSIVLEHVWLRFLVSDRFEHLASSFRRVKLTARANWDQVSCSRQQVLPLSTVVPGDSAHTDAGVVAPVVSPTSVQTMADMYSQKVPKMFLDDGEGARALVRLAVAEQVASSILVQGTSLVQAVGAAAAIHALGVTELFDGSTGGNDYIAEGWSRAFGGNEQMLILRAIILLAALLAQAAVASILVLGSTKVSLPRLICFSVSEDRVLRFCTVVAIPSLIVLATCDASGTFPS